MIKYLWFDFSGTLVKLDPQTHDRLRYSSYAEAVGKSLNGNLIAEYHEMLKKHGSNSGVFRALGLPARYWADRVNSIDPKDYCSLADSSILEILPKLKGISPISLFTNVEPEKICQSVRIDLGWFTNIIRAGMVKEPKPNLEGFYKMIELSAEKPENILYVGDSVEKDIRPAKSLGIKTCLLWSESPEADNSILRFEEIIDIVKSNS